MATLKVRQDKEWRAKSVFCTVTAVWLILVASWQQMCSDLIIVSRAVLWKNQRMTGRAQGKWCWRYSFCSKAWSIGGAHTNMWPFWWWMWYSSRRHLFAVVNVSKAIVLNKLILKVFLKLAVFLPIQVFESTQLTEYEAWKSFKVIQLLQAEHHHLSPGGSRLPRKAFR